MHSETDMLIRLLMFEIAVRKRKESEPIMRPFSEPRHEEEIHQAIKDLQRQQEHIERNVRHEAPIIYTPASPKQRASVQSVNYSPSYRKPFPGYRAAWKAERRNFTKLVPNKTMELMRMPVGLYGYTFLGQNYMAINQNLVGKFKYEVIVHESIHTPDEYETRVLTWWMMEDEELDPHLLEQRPVRVKY